MYLFYSLIVLILKYQEVYQLICIKYKKAFNHHRFLIKFKKSLIIGLD